MYLYVFLKINKVGFFLKKFEFRGLVFVTFVKREGRIYLINLCNFAKLQIFESCNKTNYKL